MRIDPTLALTLAAVVDEGTLDAAAHRLHLTPSAVSQRLRALEDQVGQRLLVRSRPVRATDPGRAVLRYARRVALLEHEVALDLGLAEEQARPRLPIAVNADSLATWFLAPLVRFAQDRDVEIVVHREDQDRTATLLESGTVLAAVTSQETPVPGCRVTGLGSLDYEAMAAPVWWERWTGATPVGRTPDAASLRRAPYVDYDRFDGLQASWLRHHGVMAHEPPRHVVPSSHDFARAVELGLGWGMLPREQTAPARADGRLRSLGAPTISTPLFWQCWKGESAALAALTADVEAEATSRLGAIESALRA